MSDAATTTPAPNPVAPAPTPPSTWARLRGAGRWFYAHILTPIGKFVLGVGDVFRAALMAAAAEAQRTDAPSLQPQAITSSHEIAMAIRGAAGASTLWTSVFSVVGVIVLALLHGAAFITPYLFPIPVLGWLIGFLISAAIKVAAKLHGGDPFVALMPAPAPAERVQ